MPAMIFSSQLVIYLPVLFQKSVLTVISPYPLLSRLSHVLQFFSVPDTFQDCPGHPLRVHGWHNDPRRAKGVLRKFPIEESLAVPHIGAYIRDPRRHALQNGQRLSLTDAGQQEQVQLRKIFPDIDLSVECHAGDAQVLHQPPAFMVILRVLIIIAQNMKLCSRLLFHHQGKR